MTRVRGSCNDGSLNDHRQRTIRCISDFTLRFDKMLKTPNSVLTPHKVHDDITTNNHFLITNCQVRLSIP